MITLTGTVGGVPRRSRRVRRSRSPAPTRSKKYDADKVGGTDDAPTFDGTFGTQHPIGTGPFKFDSWTPGDKLTIVRNDDYWGTKAMLDKVIFKPIADGPARRTALETGEIQGYDLVDPADIAALQDAGFQLLLRPAFNVGYVGFNQSKPPLDNLKIRQAIAYALNRRRAREGEVPGRAPRWRRSSCRRRCSAGRQRRHRVPVRPGEGQGSSSRRAVSPTRRSSSSTRAKSAVRTCPTRRPTSRPSRPTSRQSASRSRRRPRRGARGYLDDVNGGKAQVYLLGWTGDYGDPDNFVGTFFRTPQAAWGFDNQAIFDRLTKARDTSDPATRTIALRGSEPA